MKKFFSFAILFIASTARADEVDEPAQFGQPLSKLLLVAGIAALGALFYVRYRRARNKS